MAASGGAGLPMAHPPIVTGPPTAKGPLPTPQTRAPKTAKAPARNPSPHLPVAKPAAAKPRGKGPAKPAPLSPGLAALANPNATLSGQGLISAAHAYADAQTNPVITQLATQIGTNNRQTAGAQKQTSGYFNTLGQYVNQSNQGLSALGPQLDQQLSGIGSQTQQQIGGAFNPSGGLQNLAKLGLAQAPSQDLAQGQAAQQGLAAQDTGSVRGFGAVQSANQRGLGLSNLGTFSTRGQELLGQIGRAGQLANQPLNTQIATQRGLNATDFVKALTSLRQSEINNGITRTGLGIKENGILSANARTAATITGANSRNAATIAAENRRAAAATAAANARNAANNATTIRGQNLSHADRVAANAVRAANQAAKNGTGGAKPLTPDKQNAIYDEFDKIAGKVQSAQRAGYSKQDVIKALGSGFDAKANSGKGAKVTQYPSWMIEAVYELLGWGHVTPGTAAEMHSRGLRGGSFRGRPIGVAPPPKQTIGGVLFGG